MGISTYALYPSGFLAFAGMTLISRYGTQEAQEEIRFEWRSHVWDDGY